MTRVPSWRLQASSLAAAPAAITALWQSAALMCRVRPRGALQIAAAVVYLCAARGGRALHMTQAAWSLKLAVQ